MFGDDFLDKRYAAGREDGLAEFKANLRKFLAENPEMGIERLKDWALNGGDLFEEKESGKR